MDVLRRLLAQFQAYWAGLSRVRKFAIVAAGVGVFAALGAVIYLSPGADYQPLYPDTLPAEELNQITTRLTALAIPYRLNSSGTMVLVPEEKRPQAKVALAADGMPSRGGKGYELFDETSLTTTPFVQNVNYQRALQAELGRSIMQLEPVQFARVLIARPDPTPFVREQRPPTASVVLKLKPGASMSRVTAGSIVSLVARSVEGLKPENVTVVDSGGRLLSDPHAGDRDNLPTPQLEYRRELETYLSTKAEEMLAHHLGAGRAIIRVSADINFQQVKEKRKTIYPDEKAVTAERLTTSKNTPSTSRGVAGAASNVPRASISTSSGGSGGGSSSSEEVTQTDYNYSESVRELEDRMGAVTRLSIAALVDLSSPGEGGKVISAEDAQGIIQRAVGFRTGRDEVKLSNVSLVGEVGPPEPDAELVKLQRIQTYVSLARNICLALAVVLAIAFVPLLLLRGRRPVPTPAETPATPEDRRRSEINRLAGLARDEPERVAEVFRLLLGGSAR
ncbi:MAG TPA: flagellar basal-body MS-ring/collar protein FliF [Gemmata sp.]|jgi:flagellar M-ring protein FliF|nr:flagellar basal-body MS-ring/collar protein FliF [Gemmata sp.]